MADSRSDSPLSRPRYICILLCRRNLCVCIHLADNHQRHGLHSSGGSSSLCASLYRCYLCNAVLWLVQRQVQASRTDDRRPSGYRRCVSGGHEYALSLTVNSGLAMCWGAAGKKHLIPLSCEFPPGSGSALTLLPDIGCMIAAIGFYPLTPMHNAMFALNNAGQTKRSSALGTCLFFTQMGGVLGSNIYLSWEARESFCGCGT